MAHSYILEVVNPFNHEKVFFRRKCVYSKPPQSKKIVYNYITEKVWFSGIALGKRIGPKVFTNFDKAKAMMEEINAVSTVPVKIVIVNAYRANWGQSIYRDANEFGE